MRTFRLFFIGLIFIMDMSLSSSDECQQETVRLRAQLKTLEVQVMKQQQQLIQTLSSQRTEQLALDQDTFHDLGDHQYRDCAQIFNAGNKGSGFYTIRPMASPSLVRVYCDMTEGGGWTVIQRRSDGSQGFNRPWSDYQRGFGDLQSASGEFWLGNDNLYYLTSQGDYNLRINLADFEGVQRYAVYKNFKVADEKEFYQLQFGEFSGDSGDSLSGSYHPEVQWWASHQGMKFSTYDKDNDRYERNCAKEDKGGWWFNRCHSANLNGYYYHGAYSAVTDNGVVWYTWHGWWYSLKSVVMKIRPAAFEPNIV
ncbi:fibrinogen-like protein 1 [Salvelinus alpinus]